MQSFPSSELKRTLGDVLYAAERGPVAITKHSKPRYVLMSMDAYEQRFPSDPRQTIATEDMPQDHLAMLESAIETAEKNL